MFSRNLTTMICALSEGPPFEIPDDWWVEAGMGEFRPSSPGYLCLESPASILIRLEDIRRPHRNPGIELDFGGFRRLKMVSVLSAIASHIALPPIDVHVLPEGPKLHGLRDGHHRFYASAAAGFEFVPARVLPYFDINEC